jgi:hypothetical protein
MTTAVAVLPHRPALLKAAPLASPVALKPRGLPVLSLRALRLDRGSVVRIEDGAGTLVRVRRGIVWVTEEDSRKDVFLKRGQAHRLSRGGTAIAYADEDSRIVLEFTRGGVPRNVEIASAAGKAGRVVRLPSQGRRVTFASLVDAARSLGRALSAWWNAPGDELLHLHWPRHRVQWVENDFTPEAVRARIMNASPFPYY